MANKMLGIIDIASLKSQRKLEEAKWLEKNKVRLIEEYGVNENFSDNQLLKIRDYEVGKAICESCKGLPCRKSKGQEKYQLVQVYVGSNEVEIRERDCDFRKMRDSNERISHNFKSSNISRNYLDKTFADYEVDANNKKAVEVAKKILQGKENGAYFYGAFGTGKTFLAAIMANEFVKKDVPVLFYKVPFLVKDLRDAMFDKSNPFKESELLNQICEVPVLILDDFGMSGKVSTYAAGRLSMIIDARYEDEKLATIITSNLSLKNLKGKLDKPSDTEDAFTLDGGRITDRLREMCEAVKLGGESRRYKNVAN